MNDLTFAEATAEEFRTFWEGQGFEVEAKDMRSRYSIFLAMVARKATTTKTTIRLIAEWRRESGVDSYATFIVAHGISGETWLGPLPAATFGEALDILNELAATRAFGGWAVEEGSE